MNVCRDCMHKSTATQTYYHRMTAHLSADGRNHEPQCTMVDAAYVPTESMPRAASPSARRTKLVQLRDPPSMPSSCVGMPSITTQYALNIKRRKSLKSVTHRAYGPYLKVCLVCLLVQNQNQRFIGMSRSFPDTNAILHTQLGIIMFAHPGVPSLAP